MSRVVHAMREIERRWGTPDYCDELLANDAPSKLGDERIPALVLDERCA